MQELATLFKALSDPTRLRLTALLAIQGETCVCDLAEAIDEPDYKVSRHLSVLRSSGLAKARREGAWMHYSLVEGRTRLERCLYDCFRDGLSENLVVRKDLVRLQNAKRGEGSKCNG